MALYGLLVAPVAQADLTGPEAEAVYGGRILGIECAAISATTTGIYVSTESANSLFYGEVDHAANTFGGFSAIPDVDADDGYGSSIRQLAVHQNSAQLFFIVQNQGLFSVNSTAGSLTNVVSGNPQTLSIYDDELFYLDGGQLHVGSLDASTAVFSEYAWSPIATPGMNVPQISLIVGPNGSSSDSYVYLFYSGQANPLYVCDTDISTMDATSGFTAITTSGLNDPDVYRCFTVAGDSRLMMGGRTGMEPNHQKAFAYLDLPADTAWTEVNTGIGGTSADVIRVSSQGSTYNVYYGSAFSDNRGDSLSWQNFGINGFETHANDGNIAADPNDANVVYMTTDQGIGYSQDGGFVIAETNEGIEAVQVGDFEMDSAKEIAWMASKSGIRQVVDYQTAPSWSNAIFPNGDGSPYYSIAMDTTDHTGNTVFAGNARVYRSTDGGTTWNQPLDGQQPPWNLNFFTRVAALEVDPWDNNRVFAGYKCDRDDAKGALFFSEDGGNTFDQITDSPLPSDGLNINDILFREESSVSIAYLGVDYRFSDSTATSNGVYRVEGSSASGWTVSKDMNFAVHINDLAMDSAAGIYAVGCDLSDNANVYYKSLSSSSWDVLGSSGFPSGIPATAVTVGDDGTGTEVPYVAVGTEIYTFDPVSETWSSATQYPVGTRINVLYYDELLVGTGTGLYGHRHTAVNVDESSTSGPQGIDLLVNHPNPFNPTTLIRFELTQGALTTLNVYNLAGEFVTQILNTELGAGMHEVQWSAEGLPAGIYFARLQSGTESSIRKMTLIK